MDKLNVAIADDNTKMTDMLGQMIEEDKDLELVGKAHNGEEICSIIKDKEPTMQMLRRFRYLLYYLQLDRRGLQRMRSVLEQTTMC